MDTHSAPQHSIMPRAHQGPAQSGSLLAKVAYEYRAARKGEGGGEKGSRGEGRRGRRGRGGRCQRTLAQEFPSAACLETEVAADRWQREDARQKRGDPSLGAARERAAS
eukprot:420143-Heterocapsa_arctica.AAC.1